MVDLTPYSSVAPLMGPLDSWLGADDAERLMAYQVYEGMYRNIPDVFKLVQRGDEQNPIYLPSAKTIIEAKNRYLAKDWNYVIDPKLGTDADRATLNLALDTLFKREIIRTKFATQKRWGMIRGDQVWHIVGDIEKEATRRLSVYEVDPASYFPIFDPWNPDKILGCHLVDPVLNEAGKTVIKRQTYRKTDTGTITYELSWWETGAWDDRDDTIVLKPVQSKDIPEGDFNDPVPEEELDPRITAIPVYHIKNNRITGQPFGVSELAGLETLIGGINQTISDEDLTLALQGLGLYWTNSGPPEDDDGNETNWKFGPGWVVEIDEDSTFGRVGGVNSIQPMLDHVGKLEQAMRESSGVPDIAIGSVDVQTAESGIALAFKMGPILSGNAEKEGEMLSITDQMLYDIVTMWLPAFEQVDTPARASSIVGDPLPVNRKAILDEIILMLTNGVISIAYAQAVISERLGYEFPAEMLAQIVDEQGKLAAARNIDPFASRVAADLEDQDRGL